MRLGPSQLYVRGMDIHHLAKEAGALRLSVRDVATICENHPHAVAPLHPLFLGSGSAAGEYLRNLERTHGATEDAAELGRRIGAALLAWAEERGTTLDVPRRLSELCAELPETTALALVLRPHVEAFGAHLTASPSALDRRSASRAVLNVTPTKRIAAPDEIIDLGAAIGAITVSSAKVRYFARTIADGPKNRLSGAIGPGLVPEAEQWDEVAELLFQLYEDGAAAFVERHGDVGRLFVEELVKAERAPAPEPPNWDALASLVTSLYHRHGDAACGLIDEMVRRDELIPRRIPELEFVEADTPKDAFADTGIAGVQHLLPSLVPLIEAFIRHGAQPSDIWLLAKDYTNNPLVIAYLRTLGVHVMDATEEVDGSHHVQDTRARDVAAFARAAGPALAACGTELILDDGAPLISHLNRPAENRRRAVELTTKGHNRLLELDLSFPAISIARAPNKIDEGEVIGIDVADGLCRELRWQRGKVEGESVLAVGLGTVGSNFLAELGRRHLLPLGFDLDEGKRAVAREKVPTSRIVSNLEEGLRSADYAVLITGTGPFDARPFVAHGVQVGSGSSEAIELDENRFFELALLNAPLNGMRPLNFVRTGHETLSYRQIGLTRATFFAACTQVLGKSEPGRSELETTPALEAAADLWKREGKRDGRPRPGGVPEPPKSHAGVHPTHSEWMRFFLEGAMSEEAPVMVRPAPSAVNFAPQPYLYFHEEDWHLVDTRTGESQRLRLDAEWKRPETQLVMLADSGPEASALMRPTKDGCELAVIGRQGGLSRSLRLGRPISASTRRKLDEPEVRFAWIFEGQDQIQVVSGGPKARVHRFDRVDDTPSTFAVVGEEALLQVTAEPSVYLHTLDGGIQRLNNHGMDRIIGLSTPSNRPDESTSVFLIGREPSGRTAVIRFDSADAIGRVVLPDGAVYRRINAFAGRAPEVVFERDGRLHRVQVPLSA